MRLPHKNTLSRKDTRLLSSRQDLTLSPNKSICLQGKRGQKKLCTIKVIDSEDVTYEHFSLCYRQKTPSDHRLILNSLKSHFTFSEQEDSVLSALVKKFCLCAVEFGEYLFKQEDSASCFFILFEGELSVEINGMEIKRIKKGDGFGELALLYNSPRSASIRSVGKSFLWYINRFTFMNAIKTIIEGKFDANLKIIEESTILSSLTRDQRRQLASIAMRQCYVSGSEVCKKGEMATHLFMLVEGCITQENGTQIERATVYMEAGQVWRENVRAESDSCVIALSTKDIESTLGHSLPVAILRNKLRICLSKKFFLNKLSSEYIDRLLDSFSMRDKLEVGKLSKCSQCIFYHDGNILGVDCLLNPHMLYEEEYSILGSIAQTSLLKVEQHLGCTFVTALAHSEEQRLIQQQRADELSKKKIKAEKYSLEGLFARKELGEGNFGKVLLVSTGMEGSGEVINYLNTALPQNSSNALSRHNSVVEQQYFALKCLSKSRTMESRMYSYLRNEKQALQEVVSPFLVDYIRCFSDTDYVYFLLQFVRGRELFDVMRDFQQFPLDLCCFYISILINILELFHSSSIIYRDLKPENILVTTEGYLKLVDMGTCKRLPQKCNKTFTIIGTPNYMAPEVIIGKGYSFAADLWSLGVVAYELIVGHLPYGENAEDIYSIYQEIIKKEIIIEEPILKQLLDKMPFNRLGGSYMNLKKHPFFSGINWLHLGNKKLPPAYRVDKEDVEGLPRNNLHYYLKHEKTNAQIMAHWDQDFGK